MAAKLGELGFDTQHETDSAVKLMDIRLGEFGAKLTGYEAGRFFFAGHGISDTV